MEALERLLAAMPSPPDWRTDWAAIEASALGDGLRALRGTPQDPEYHGEGDVWEHTVLVCESLCSLPAFRELEGRARRIVFLAALLHDLGKASCTRMEDGRWVSPRHAAIGAREARRRLWLYFGLCGSPETQAFRESVCTLIRYHSLPPRAIGLQDGVRRLRAAAADAAQAGASVDLRLLCMLAEADILGRAAADRDELLERVRLCEVLAEEAGCLDGPYPFPTAYTRFSYLSGRAVPPELPLHDDTWGEVVMLSGLPGTGKDTWIRAHCPDLPQISLDAVRAELDIRPTDDQGPVAGHARARARELLRAKIPFVWNATDLSPALRQKGLSLFHAYHASVRIIYLETGWEEELRRNRGRPAAVPEQAILRMLDRLEPPGPSEAREVQWFCV